MRSLKHIHHGALIPMKFSMVLKFYRLANVDLYVDLNCVLEIDYTKNSGLARVAAVWPIDMCFHLAQSLQWLPCMQ